VGVPEHFLVASRLHRSLGRPELAQEALSQALVLAGQGPVLGLLLAEVGDVKESEGDLPSAVQAYEQAVPRCDAAAPLAAWHGELDFRARVETRLAGVLMAMKDPDAKLLLGSSLQRWRAAGAPQYEARVLANLGALAVAEGKLADAATLFTQAAATAEGAGDFVFEARQLVSLAKVQARAGQAEARQTAEAARRRAAAVGWEEGVKAAAALLKAE
jgi:tetratricopeptide (TPR) repeat protein